MPQWVQHACTKYSELDVVLCCMANGGFEGLALAALECGKSKYTPGGLINKYLAEAIDHDDDSSSNIHLDYDADIDISEQSSTSSSIESADYDADIDM